MGKGLIILLLGLFMSCAVAKKEKSSTTSSVEKTEKVTDTTSKETVNKKIDDSATIRVVESQTGDAEFDKRVNDAVANVLRSVNFQKSSGDNSYRAYYDEKLKALQFQVELGETRDKEVSTNNEANTEKTLETEISEYIKKIVIPWWMYLIAAFLLRKPILAIAGFIYPPIRALTSLKSVMTPPK